MNVKLFQQGRSFPYYAAPQLCQTDLCAQGVICESFSIPELQEENIDITWGNDPNA